MTGGGATHCIMSLCVTLSAVTGTADSLLSAVTSKVSCVTGVIMYA